MKITKLAKPLMLGLTLSLAAAGCKSTKPPVTQVPPGGGMAGQGNDIGTGGKLPGGTTPEGIEKNIAQGLAFGSGHPGWTQNREALQADTVHFDYDKSTIRADEKQKVAAVADYLKGNSDAAVLI